MRTTRSGRKYSPFEEVLNTEAGMEGLMTEAMDRFFASSIHVSGAINSREEGVVDVVNDWIDEVPEEDLTATSDVEEHKPQVQQLMRPLLTKAQKDKRRRKEKRRMDRTNTFWGDKLAHNADAFGKIMQGAHAIEGSLSQGDVLHLPSSSCGYLGKAEGSSRSSKVVTLQELIDKGYKIIPWNGRDTKLITHGPDKTVIAACVGWEPDSDDHEDLCQDAYLAFKEAREKLQATAQDSGNKTCNPRGDFKSILCGIIHGHGSQYPHDISVDRHKKPVVDSLLIRKSIVRLANFASSSLSMFAPKLYRYYHDRMKELAESVEFRHLNRPFQGSIFACAGFNIGERVATFMHRDCMNCPFGWCSVQPLGPFDSKKGGHMVLEDLKVAIEFPSGSLMMIPSATLKHGNSAVGEDEDRVSFTQFTPGNIFRFVDCKFQTEKSIEATNPAVFKIITAMKRSRWEEGVKLWSTLNELLEASMNKQG